MIRIAINGMGRMGRLFMRAVQARDDMSVVLVNELAMPAETVAHLLQFDSVQGSFAADWVGEGQEIRVAGRGIPCLQEPEPGSLDLGGVDLLVECTGRFRSLPDLVAHQRAGAGRILVSAPVKGEAPNVVVGVNHGAFDLRAAAVVSAASCTTNCLAPVVHVLHESIGVERGLVTTIHDPTNTQNLVDAAHKDPRRARSGATNLIPTSTNSATAVTRIIPELLGKLDSIAVRAPVFNASLTDAVLQVARDTCVDEVNAALSAAAEGPMQGILGVEARPLVSSDFVGDPRSGIVDLDCTRVTDQRLVKVLAWYDNEWGYVNRMVDLAALMHGLPSVLDA